MGRKFRGAVLLPAVLGALGGCAAPGTQGEAYITNAADIVKAADWTKTETVTVTLEEHTYTPTQLRLKAGQPYKLVMQNRGDKEHYYTAPEFFRAIATRKAMVSQPSKIAEMKAPYFTAFEVYKGGNLELYFVPVNKGTYQVFCSIDDHRDKGMDGTIVVE